MRNAEVDQARFLASGHDFDREAECGACLFQECCSILGHAQRVGAYRTHAVRIEAAQSFAETFQAVKCTLLGDIIETLVTRQAAAESHWLTQGIERVNLIADDTRNLQVERIRSEVNRGKR